jgi:hypothetical protein
MYALNYSAFQNHPDYNLPSAVLDHLSNGFFDPNSTSSSGRYWNLIVILLAIFEIKSVQASI